MRVRYLSELIVISLILVAMIIATVFKRKKFLEKTASSLFNVLLSIIIPLAGNFLALSRTIANSQLYMADIYEFARAIESEDIIRIILFGSVARRDDKEESDIDILIITPSREKINSIVDEEVFNINAKYLEVVSAHIMTEEFYNRTKDYSFLTSVREEGVLLVGDY